MKRQEEILSQAVKEQSQLYQPPEWRAGFISGAKWSDKTMLDRACKWLQDGGYFVNSNETIEDFRKAMKGGAE